MARVKRGLTDPDGTKEAKRTRTKPQPVEAKKFTPVESITNIVEKAANGIQSVTNNVTAGIGNVTSTVNQLAPKSPLTTTPSIESFDKGLQIASSYGVSEIQLRELLTTDPYSSDSAIPQMNSSESNRHKLAIRKQMNALEVREATIGRDRKVVQIAKEQTHLIGDIVDYHTAKIEVGSKVIDNQIADTNYGIRQSKLLQTEELLDQQRVATQGTLNLTEGIRQEWELKFQLKESNNQALRLQIEGAKRTNEMKLQEIEALILE